MSQFRFTVSLSLAYMASLCLRVSAGFLPKLSRSLSEVYLDSVKYPSADLTLRCQSIACE